jgi:hypothetical protein
MISWVGGYNDVGSALLIMIGFPLQNKQVNRNLSMVIVCNNKLSIFQNRKQYIIQESISKYVAAKYPVSDSF